MLKMKSPVDEASSNTLWNLFSHPSKTEHKQADWKKIEKKLQSLRVAIDS
jgi:hypothetical protein